MASRDGYFAPESVIRRVGDSPLVPLLGGGPAVLLQVAHPLVAVGVVHHSDYRNDLWRRLLRTLQALYLIVYGNKQEAERAGEAVRAVHAHGGEERAARAVPRRDTLRSLRPGLMLWVHATLVETSLAVYGRFVGRLAPDEEEAYYREMALVARVFGLPSSALPATLADSTSTCAPGSRGRRSASHPRRGKSPRSSSRRRCRRRFASSLPRTASPPLPSSR